MSKKNVKKDQTRKIVYSLLGLLVIITFLIVVLTPLGPVAGYNTGLKTIETTNGCYSIFSLLDKSRGFCQEQYINSENNPFNKCHLLFDEKIIQFFKSKYNTVDCSEILEKFTISAHVKVVKSFLLLDERYILKTISLNDGRILILGGNKGNKISVEAYNPKNNNNTFITNDLTPFLASFQDFNYKYRDKEIFSTPMFLPNNQVYYRGALFDANDNKFIQNKYILLNDFINLYFDNNHNRNDKQSNVILLKIFHNTDVIFADLNSNKIILGNITNKEYKTVSLGSTNIVDNNFIQMSDRSIISWNKKSIILINFQTGKTSPVIKFKNNKIISNILDVKLISSRQWFREKNQLLIIGNQGSEVKAIILSPRKQNRISFITTLPDVLLEQYNNKGISSDLNNEVLKTDVNVLNSNFVIVRIANLITVLDIKQNKKFSLCEPLLNSNNTIIKLKDLEYLVLNIRNICKSKYSEELLVLNLEGILIRDLKE